MARVLRYGMFIFLHRIEEDREPDSQQGKANLWHEQSIRRIPAGAD